MTTILEHELDGPGTHALVVGIGAADSPVSTHHQSERAATIFATWVSRSLRNHNAPFASLEWLGEGPFQTERAKQLADRPLGEFGNPSDKNFIAALGAWRNRLRRRPGSVGIFYFAGPALKLPEETYLLFPGSGEPSAIGLRELMRTLDEDAESDVLCIADTEYFEAESVVHRIALPPSPRRGPVPGGRALVQVHREIRSEPFASPLAIALMRIFEEESNSDRPDMLTASRLAGLVQGRIEPEVRNAFNSEIHRDFAFHDGSMVGGTATDWREIVGGIPMPGPLQEGESPAEAAHEQGITSAQAGWPQTTAHPIDWDFSDERSIGAEPGAGPAAAEFASRSGTLPRAPTRDEPNTEFIPDDAETERDELGRSVLAISLARRLHRIWRTSNEKSDPQGAEDGRAAFVVHLDAPWGGGKTTFANFMAQVLNPLAGSRGPAAFLRDRYGEADMGGIFLEDPPADEAAARRLAKLLPRSRRPWIVVPFNAWQAEHCAPPWWVFYEAIRKQCFRAIRREGDLAWRPRAPSPSHAWKARPVRLVNRILGRARGLDRWPVLVAREYAWRARNPKILALFATAAFGGLLLLLLYRLGAWGAVESKGTTTAGFVLTSGLGLLAAGLTGVTGLWALAALFTESIVPGSNSLAERISLGAGDPFERFRKHFYRTMADLRRPVMVIIDDLDRCRPDFVVDLVRGIQTLLRSPRVVFVILGDRDWIERAFEAHHKAMEKVDVGREQTFGARFVEKAIQMSFILPAMGDQGRLAYVRRVLLGSAEPAERESTAAVDADTAKAVREVVNRETSAPGADPFDTQRILAKALEEVGARGEAPIAERDALQVEQLVGETLAINATSSERVEQAVAHQLEALAVHFPANPRQIKRIVNAITIYYAVALQRPGLNPDEAFRTQLALWVIIMTEWPETWRLLASFPSLVRLLQAEDPVAAVNAEGADLPGSPKATAKVVQRILADSELMALIKGSGSVPLDPAQLPLLAQLTPVHSRKRRLMCDEAAEDGGKAQASR